MSKIRLLTILGLTAVASLAAGTVVASAAGPTVPYGPVHGRLTAVSHYPKANKPWRMWVTATDRRGRGLSGTISIAFTYGGAVVGRDNSVNRLRNGRWTGTETFPSRSIGYPLAVRVTVRTRPGTITMSWWIKVVK